MLKKDATNLEVWSFLNAICLVIFFYYLHIPVDQYVTLQSVQKLYQSDFFPKNKIGYYADNVIYMIFTETVFPFLKTL